MSGYGRLVAVQQAEQVLVVDGFFTIREFGEAVVNIVELGAREGVAEFDEALLEQAAPTMFAEHHVGGRYADRLRCHDLVGQWVGHHAVLMDA